MKLSLTVYDTTITIERPSDDQSAEDMRVLFRELLLAAGYHPASVDDVLGEVG